MIVRRGRPRFTVRIEVPRMGGLRAWGAIAADFERWLAEQVGPVVREARVESETRRGPDSVRVRIAVTTRAADVGQAAVIAWDVFRVAAGDDLVSWDLGAASAQIRPAAAARLAQRLSSRPPVETGGDLPVPQHLDLPFPLPAADDPVGDQEQPEDQVPAEHEGPGKQDEHEGQGDEPGRWPADAAPGDVTANLSCDAHAAPWLVLIDPR